MIMGIFRIWGCLGFADFTVISGLCLAENIRLSGLVTGLLTGAEIGIFGGVITNNSQTYRHFSDMFVAILIINYESIRCLKKNLWFSGS